MDHTGGYVMGIALLAALYHRRRTGEGQWVDLACIEAGIAHDRPGRARRDRQRAARSASPGRSDANRSPSQSMVPHGIYPCRGRRLVGRHRLPPRRRLGGARRRSSASRGRRTPALADRRRPPRRPGRARRRRWRRGRRRSDRDAIVAARPRRRRAGGARASARPSAATATPTTTAWGLWPTVEHTKHGALRVDGLPVHLSATDWRIRRGGPVLGEDNERVLTEVLGLTHRRDRAARRRGGHLMGEPTRQPGPLAGLRVVELSHEHVAFAGKLLADLGAEVTVVEPPGGSRAAHVRPVRRRRAGPGAQPVVVALQHVQARRRRRPRRPIADALRAPRRRRRRPARGRGPGVLAAAGLDWATLSAADPRLVMVSITPFGPTSPRAAEPVTDLTLLAEGGPVWSCGYDDHTLPPVRGGGNQAFHTAGNWAMLATLVALLAREESGAGPAHRRQHARRRERDDRDGDVRLADGRGGGAAPDGPPRRAGLHAHRCRCAAPTVATPRPGVPPRDPQTFAAILALLDRLGLRDEFPASVILQLGAELDAPLNFADALTDPLVAEILTAAATSCGSSASTCRRTTSSSRRSRSASPPGSSTRPARRWPTRTSSPAASPSRSSTPSSAASFTYPGAPYRFTAHAVAARPRAPLLGEHQSDLS